jgi:hypothetical protein
MVNITKNQRQVKGFQQNKSLNNLTQAVDGLTATITSLSNQLAHNVPAVTDVWGR